ncbi:dihydrofolate reductase family protein [Hymenobacter lucidus]|uniref:Dihydrofolate reductase family protein n=1 Tax=Hymenobacter lucidus TaxID=2880930 RepID=A0ABS8ANG9_9BACT|nr:dihydrofolate reductase family protein [Hymenobacter lucidus]MCB2406846.1 dihydrofolate reductase family protein [Hymenobacter lucidus]
MRKIIMLMHVSLDGFVADPAGNLDWVRHDGEIFDYVTEHFQTVDTCLYGRATYQSMRDYWPTVPANPASTERQRHHASWVEQVAKVVISTTLPHADWHNTRLISGNVAEEIQQLRQQPGRNMMLFGSPRLAHSFMQLGLIDEYLLNVNPVLLGQGVPLFHGARRRTPLELLSSRTFSSGVIGLHYQHEKA